MYTAPLFWPNTRDLLGLVDTQTTLWVLSPHWLHPMHSWHHLPLWQCEHLMHSNRKWTFPLLGSWKSGWHFFTCRSTQTFLTSDRLWQRPEELASHHHCKTIPPPQGRWGWNVKTWILGKTCLSQPVGKALEQKLKPHPTVLRGPNYSGTGRLT
jgi:hypothetical protein